MNLTYIGGQQIAAATLNSAQALNVPAGALMARICVIEATKGSNNALYVTEDSTVPSSTNGDLIFAGKYEYWTELAKLRFLNDTTSGCRLSVYYYK